MTFNIIWKYILRLLRLVYEQDFAFTSNHKEVPHGV